MIEGIHEKAVSPMFKTAYWINAEEGKFISDKVRESSAYAYFECGTCHGYSASWIADRCPGVEIHTWDPQDRGKIWDKEELGLAALKKNITFYNEPFHEGVRKVLSKRDKNKKIAIFIDGGHSAGEVRKDWEAVSWYLRKGDIVLFHDISGEKSVMGLWAHLPKLLPTSKFEEFPLPRRGIGVIYFDEYPERDTEGELKIRSGSQKIPELFNWNNVKVRDTIWATDYKPWTQYPEQALLSSSESHLIYDAAIRLGAGNYAHLGVWKGNSVAYTAYGLTTAKQKGTIYAVDVFSCKPVKDMPTKIPAYFNQLGLNRYADLKICKGFTNDWAERLKDLKFRWVFIDAGHYYWDCRDDFENWAPMVEVGGEVAFHDCEYDTVAEAIKDAVDPAVWQETNHVWRTRVFRKIL